MEILSGQSGESGSMDAGANQLHRPDCHQRIRNNPLRQGSHAAIGLQDRCGVHQEIMWNSIQRIAADGEKTTDFVSPVTDPVNPILPTENLQLLGGQTVTGFVIN